MFISKYQPVGFSAIFKLFFLLNHCLLGRIFYVGSIFFCFPLALVFYIFIWCYRLRRRKCRPGSLHSRCNKGVEKIFPFEPGEIASGLDRKSRPTPLFFYWRYCSRTRDVCSARRRSGSERVSVYGVAAGGGNVFRSVGYFLRRGLSTGPGGQPFQGLFHPQSVLEPRGFDTIPLTTVFLLLYTIRDLLNSIYESIVLH